MYGTQRPTRAAPAQQPPAHGMLLAVKERVTCAIRGHVGIYDIICFVMGRMSHQGRMYMSSGVVCVIMGRICHHGSYVSSGVID